MKKNDFKKYINLMKKSTMYFVEYDRTHYYIANSYILLRVPERIYKAYFYGVNSEMFPDQPDENITMTFTTNRSAFEMAIAEERINFERLVPENKNTCVLTNAILQLKTCTVNCYAVAAEEPFVVTVNHDFVKAFTDIFENHCTIYGGNNFYSPVLYNDTLQDISGFILPVRDINNQETKQGILKQHNLV